MKFLSIYTFWHSRWHWILLLPFLFALAGCSVGRSQPEIIDTAAASPPPSQQNLEMVRALSQLSALKEDLKQMRNTVEQMQFQQENADRRQQDLFQDIDRRLLGLENKVEAFSVQTDGTPQAQISLPDDVAVSDTGQLLAQGQTGIGPSVVNQVGQTDGSVDSAPKADTVTVVSATPSRSAITTPSTTQSSGDNAGTSSVSLTEQQAYESAFDLLKQSRYDEAIKQFDALVNTWPNSELADDALYWKSEANYVNREFEAALNGFRSIVERYPDSSRLPEAMLKVGYIQYDIGAYDQAAQTFQDILARFPGHQVTVSADTRLRRIQQTIQ